MKNRLLIIFYALAFLIVLVPHAAFAQGMVALNAIADKAPGDNVTITGTATINEVTIKVIRPDDIILYVDVAEVNSGSYSVTFRLPDDAAEGEYTVVVGQGRVVATKSFNVVDEPEYVAVMSTNPADGATNILRVPIITLTFSEDVSAGEDYGEITLKDADNSSGL